LNPSNQPQYATANSARLAISGGKSDDTAHAEDIRNRSAPLIAAVFARVHRGLLAQRLRVRFAHVESGPAACGVLPLPATDAMLQ
jgi:hypothetical protein